MPSPVDKIKALQKKSIERNGAFLPKWDAANRAAPNEIVRSALFNARNKTKKREYFKQTEIALIGNGSIKYTGEELRQDDETVWLQVLHLAREHPLEDLIEFSAYSILKSLDWPTTVFYYKKLEECLNRMAATNVIIESKRLGKSCAVSIIRKYEKSDDGKMWRVWIEKEMKSLFDGNCYTLSEWEQRLALPVHASKPAALPAAAATPPFKLPWSGGATRPSPQCHGAACPREGSRGRGGGQNAAAEAAGTAAAAAAGAAPALSFASALRQVHRPL